MSELARKASSITALVAFGLGANALAGCGSTESGNVTASVESTTKHDSGTQLPTATYYSDGTRLLVLDAANDAKLAGNNYYLSSIFEFCDGTDLVEEAESYAFRSGVISPSLSRSVNHPACADGRLTPSDFAVPTHSSKPAN